MLHSDGMAASFYFYDLETTGINARQGRIMQFAGQRTDLNLKPIGEPDNMLIKITSDILPEPDAIMVTGLTPQATLVDGITEAEFLRYFKDHIGLKDTIFVGFNNVRFDDEFIRFAMYRNFYDAYEWCWQDQRSRWDMLDVVRMTRALRPEGIQWPFRSDGKASNSLGLLTAINKLEHSNAHEALSDVHATIAVARLIRNKQTKLFDFLLGMRDKKKVAELVNKNEPFVYTSGKYPSVYEKTTVVISLGEHPGKQGHLVYDLRTDPQTLKDMTPEMIAKTWYERVEDETKRFPIKTLQFNRCPAVAPLSVLDDQSIERIKLDMNAIKLNKQKLKKMPELRDKLLKAIEIMDQHRQVGLIASEIDVDTQLYDGFFNDSDKNAMAVVRAAEAETISSLNLEFKDDRLTKLLPLYKARNYPQILTPEEYTQWEHYRYQRLMKGGLKSLATRYFTRLGELAKRPNLTEREKYLLEELQLYGESVLPEPEEEE